MQISLFIYILISKKEMSAVSGNMEKTHLCWSLCLRREPHIPTRLWHPAGWTTSSWALRAHLPDPRSTKPKLCISFQFSRFWGPYAIKACRTELQFRLSSSFAKVVLLWAVLWLYSNLNNEHDINICKLWTFSRRYGWVHFQHFLGKSNNNFLY